MVIAPLPRFSRRVAADPIVEAREHNLEARTWRDAVEMMRVCVVDHFGNHELAIRSFRSQALDAAARATKKAEDIRGGQ